MCEMDQQELYQGLAYKELCHAATRSTTALSNYSQAGPGMDSLLCSCDMLYLLHVA